MQQGNSKTEALQKAQNALLTGKVNHNLAHPYYWEAFILIGNGL
ncbi:MAG: CHAT domain-containing protein [Oscillatoriales cyanobacterium RM2_1_1]|nr:CHAT domain-containing protein [Oscillatoriales cyanobacterium RM2_1_1]